MTYFDWSCKHFFCYDFLQWMIMKSEKIVCVRAASSEYRQLEINLTHIRWKNPMHEFTHFSLLLDQKRFECMTCYFQSYFSCTTKKFLEDSFFTDIIKVHYFSGNSAKCYRAGAWKKGFWLTDALNCLCISLNSPHHSIIKINGGLLCGLLSLFSDGDICITQN